MAVERLVASHLRLAKAALDDAASLRAAGSRNVVYLAEQAVEQLVYALAQVEGIHFGRGQQHQLDTMVRTLPHANRFVADLRPLTWLEAYATTFRYPKPGGGLTRPPSDEKLDAALEAATEILTSMADFFIVDLRPEAETPAKNIDPPRSENQSD